LIIQNNTCINEKMDDQRLSRERKDDPVQQRGGRIISGNSILRGMVARLAATRFVRDAPAENADLKALTAKPTPRVWIGLGLVGFSYIIGWPAVALLAWTSYQLREPLIIVVGGPVTYGLSHLVFLAGSYLAGVHYVRIFLRWATRRLTERLTGAVAAPPECVPPSFSTDFRGGDLPGERAVRSPLGRGNSLRLPFSPE
jgi:hypothetical protein